MSAELTYLAITAITISLVHTITGPDHYLPFIALSKAKRWSVYKTIRWTLICGIGHVASSVLLGLAGIALGWSLSSTSWVENIRGGIAGWIMFAAGIAYVLYAFIQLRRNKLHKHFDSYGGDEIYVYEHRHGTTVNPQQKRKVTPWVLLIIFILGPCEPLVPLLSYPAAQQSVTGILVLVSVFTGFTLLTMVTMVLLGYYGLSIFKTGRLEKYMHVLAGSTVLICGAGMLFMEW
jgi:sulfite exporter TauE/SafE